MEFNHLADSWIAGIRCIFGGLLAAPYLGLQPGNPVALFADSAAAAGLLVGQVKLKDAFRCVTSGAGLNLVVIHLAHPERQP